MRVREALGEDAHPSGHRLGRRERAVIAAMLIDVEMAAEDLVVRVEGRPDLHAAAKAIELLLRERREVAAAERLLALRELLDHRGRARAKGLVARRGVRQRAGREVVAAREVSSQLAVRLLPSAERLGRRRDSGVDAERVQKAVRRHRHQVAGVPVARLEERAGQQTHLLERERADRAGDEIAIRVSRRRTRVERPSRRTQGPERRGRRPCREKSATRQRFLGHGVNLRPSLPRSRNPPGRLAA